MVLRHKGLCIKLKRKNNFILSFKKMKTIWLFKILKSPFFTHKKCPIMFIMLHSSSITLYYHSFSYCSRLGFLLFFIFFISFHPLKLGFFTPIQQIEHFVAFKFNRTLKTMIFLKPTCFID